MKGIVAVKTWQLSRLEHLAFTEFLEMAEDAIFDPDYPANGSFHQRRRGGHTYWYYQRHTGMSPSGKQTVESRYVGKVGTQEIEDRIADFSRIKEQRRIRRRLIVMLRYAGLPSPRPEDQQIVTAIAHTGIFKAGGVLIGPMAVQSYCGLLGVRMASVIASDEDDDDHAIIVPPVGPTGDIVTTLSHNGRLPIVRLAPATDDDLGLTHYLVDQPVRSALICDDAISVRVPDPARYAVYKIVLSQLRTSTAPLRKTRKDRTQAEQLIEALAAAGRTPELAEAFGLMWTRYPKVRPSLAEGALALANKLLSLLANTCHRFGEQPFTESADPSTVLRPVIAGGAASKTKPKVSGRGE